MGDRINVSLHFNVKFYFVRIAYERESLNSYLILIDLIIVFKNI